MSSFPITIDGTTFPDVDALVAHVTDRLARRVLRNPGEYHASEYYTDHSSNFAPGGRRVANALWEASAILVRTSDDPYVLEGVASFCSLCKHDPVYEAVLARLDGTDRPFPETTEDRLRQRFVDVVSQFYVCRHPTLGPRTRAWLKRTGQHDQLVGMLSWTDPDDEIVEAVRSAVEAGGLDIWMLSSVAIKVANERHDELLPIARIIASLPKEHRREYFERVEEYAGKWLAAHGQALREVLAL